MGCVVALFEPENNGSVANYGVIIVMNINGGIIGSSSNTRLAHNVCAPCQGRYPIAKASSAFTCGLTGMTYTAAQAIQYDGYLARAVARCLGFLLSSYNRVR